MGSVDQYVLFVMLSSAAGVCSIGAAVALVFVRGKVVFPSLRGSLFAQTGWLLCNILELLDPTEAGTMFWSQMGYPFLTFGIVLWFAFTLEYSGLARWLEPSRLILFFIAPLVTTILAFTNDMHHLIWVSLVYVPVRSFGSVVAIVVRRGLWFWFWFVYAYSIFACGVFLIVRELFRKPRRYDRHSPWLLVGAFLPIAVNACYLFKVVPGWTKDYSPLAFVVGGLCATFGTMNYRLLRAGAITRRELVERMSEGIMAVDRRGSVVDINPVAERLLGLPDDFSLGSPAVEALPAWPGLALPREGGGELVLKANSSSGAPLSLRIVGMSDEKGCDIGWYVMIAATSLGAEDLERSRRPSARLKYEKDSLTPSVMATRYAALVLTMKTEKLYLDPDLDLQSLSDRTGINRNDISQILNVHAGKSFSDFLGEFRINEVVRLFEDPGSSRLTILDIAFASGFNSKATFNLVFKKMKGMSPSEYRNRR